MQMKHANGTCLQLVCYACLALEDGPQTVEGVRARCNKLLRDMNPDSNVNFDAQDAVNTLTRQRVLTHMADGSIKVRVHSFHKSVHSSIYQSMYTFASDHQESSIISALQC
jgi:hypothetical protein